MDYTDQNQRPLLEALYAYAAENRISWHMPGHNNGEAWPLSFRGNLASIDTTELAVTDDLNHPEGPARHAMLLASKAFGSGYTRFLTSGSTTAIQLLLAAAVGTDGKMLVARTCHQSVVHAAACLNIELILFHQTGYPEHENQLHPKFSLFPQATQRDVEVAMDENPNCRAVWLTSPDYYGNCAAIRQIADCVHQRGGRLLVDEAHGAHFCFAEGLLPPSALKSGADAAVQSGHKTLPVLTGGALLHISQDALDSGSLPAEEVDRLLPVFQSSSPSFPIAASLDYARSSMVEEGRERVLEQLALFVNFGLDLDPRLICRPERTSLSLSAQGIDYDPLRLVVTTREPAWLFVVKALAAQLHRLKMDIEYADLTRLVLIPSLWQTRENWQLLASVLNESVRSLSFQSTEGLQQGTKLMELEEKWRNFLPPRSADRSLTAREALLGKQKRQYVPLSESAGYYAARPLAPYPPGVPIIWPGERIDAEAVDFMTVLLENSISISGMTNDQVPVIM